MANFCYPLHDKISEKLVEVVVVPTGATLTAGDIILAETLVVGSKKVYAGTKVADITKDEPAIIIDQRFEELVGGRRPDGGNMLEDIKFVAGDKVHVIRLSKNMKYEIAIDKLDNTGVVVPAAGVFLIPKNGSWTLSTSATIGTAKVALKIEAVASVPTGGNLGLGFSGSVIARVVLA